MKYCKIVKDGYILAVGIDINGVEIIKEEYENILQIISQCPAPNSGHGRRLTENLQWEEYELVANEMELTETEQKAQAYDILMGVTE